VAYFILSPLFIAIIYRRGIDKARDYFQKVKKNFGLEIRLKTRVGQG
jgi:ABC-type Fe3+ transport system substrate-binding protein